jgi:hypothetical protein
MSTLTDPLDPDCASRGVRLNRVRGVEAGGTKWVCAKGTGPRDLTERGAGHSIRASRRGLLKALSLVGSSCASVASAAASSWCSSTRLRVCVGRRSRRGSRLGRARSERQLPVNAGPGSGAVPRLDEES